MKKIKVAFFAEILIKDFDGASRTMFQLINRIPDIEFEFLFVCGRYEAGFSQKYKVYKVPTLRVPGNETYSFSVPALKNFGLKAALEKFQPDVVHIATPSFLGNFGLHYATSRQIPVISIYHTHFSSYMAYYFKKAPFLVGPATTYVQKTSTNFYNNCNLVYIPSQTLAAELQTWGIKSQVEKIWKRGVDLSLFSPKKRDEGFVPKITGNTQKNILFSSRLVWEKNLETLIRLYQFIEKKKLPYNLIVAGSGVAEEECRKLMPKAYFMGHMGHNELSVLYASADVFMFPSVTETFGNVVLEAMASGLPCIIADGGGSKDFIENAENGFLVEPHNVEEYLHKIEEIFSDKNLWEKFSKAGLDYSKTFNWDYLASVYFDDLKELSHK